MFEEVLDTGFSVKDMFVYSVEFNYDVGRLGLSFAFGNFLNVNQIASQILPIPEYSSGMANTVGYEIDSPFLLALGISFNF